MDTHGQMADRLTEATSVPELVIAAERSAAWSRVLEGRGRWGEGGGGWGGGINVYMSDALLAGWLNLSNA